MMATARARWATVLRARLVWVPWLLVPLPACSNTEAPGSVPETGQPTAAEREVRAHLESYYDVFSERDWPRFARHFWDGATMTTVWTPEGERTERVVATTVPDFVAQAPDGPGSREIFEERPVSFRIVVEGDLAQARVRYHARFGDPGEVIEWDGVDAFTLIRYGGEWKITSLAYLSDPS